MHDDAISAFEALARIPRSGPQLSRRKFIFGSAAAGGLLVGVASPVLGKVAAAAAKVPAAPMAAAMLPMASAPANQTLIGSWILVGSDETVTVYIGASEMGQGVTGGLPQIVAEELKVDWSKVTFALADANSAFANPFMGGQLTGGSTSTRGYYDLLRNAGAAAREMLVGAAAARWGVAASACTAANGVVTHAASGRSATYGSLAADAATQPVPTSPQLTDPSQFTIIGTSRPRPDIPLKVTGAAKFGIDVRLPNMVYATVVHCPAFGGTVAGSVSTPPGAIAAIALGDAVAVVADNTWTAMQAAEQLQVRWNVPSTAKSTSSSKIAATAKKLMKSKSAIVAETSGNATTALAGAPTKLNLTYALPYLAHACMEPLNCTASVTPTSCEIWAPTQGQSMNVSTAAAITGLDPSQIVVHTTFLGGGLGRKFEQDFVAQAVTVSKALGRPVKLTWKREEDFAHDQYRPAALVNVQAGLDGSGNVVAWKNRIVSSSILGQRGWLPPGAVDSQAVDGAVELPYALGARLVDWVPHPATAPVGFWRSVGHSINAFSVESAIDELAAAAGKDPVAFRRSLLPPTSKHRAVLDAVTSAANWGGSLPAGHALGVALHEGFGSIVGMVVELSKATATTAKLWNVWVTIDCGQVINPDQVRAQLEGAFTQGLTAAMWGEIPIQNGASTVRQFDKYKMARMRDMPVIHASIMPSTGALGGVGEPGVPPVAPAIANAWFTLTGTRLRNLPMRIM